MLGESSCADGDDRWTEKLDKNGKVVMEEGNAIYQYLNTVGALLFAIMLTLQWLCPLSGTGIGKLVLFVSMSTHPIGDDGKLGH